MDVRFESGFGGRCLVDVGCDIDDRKEDRSLSNNLTIYTGKTRHYSRVMEYMKLDCSCSWFPTLIDWASDATRHIYFCNLELIYIKI